MKQMSKDAQIQMNGGAWVHCTHCGKNIRGITKNSAKSNFMNKHKNSVHRFWDYGRFEDCKTCH